MRDEILLEKIVVNPTHALSDATTQFALEKLELLLENLLKIHELARVAVKTS